MIAYRVHRGAASAIVRLAILQLAKTARLEVEGDPDLVADVRRRFMSLGVTIPKFSSVQGLSLVRWIGSDTFRDLAPQPIEGLDIIAYGGTYSQDSCDEGERIIARRIALLVRWPRTQPIDGYAWEWQVDPAIIGAKLELRAWRTACGAAPDRRAGLVAAIADALARDGSTLDGARVLAAFEAASERDDARQILDDLWRSIAIET